MEGDKAPCFKEMKTHLHPFADLSLHSAGEVTAQRFVLLFCDLMAEELSFRREKGFEVLPLRVYYKNMFAGENILIPAGANGYSFRLGPAVEECRNLRGKGRILDAGSGYGTESLLFSLLGNEVTGVELVSERAQIALSRVDYYASVWDSPLNLKFVNADVFRFLEKAEPFDIIWIMEAISHIHPAEDFLDLTYRKLKKSGKIIISDPNRLNPLAWVRSVKIRGSLKHKTHQRFKDPETGRPVDYGQERIFSASRMQQMLIERGFQIERAYVSGFMGTSFIPGPLLLKKSVVRFLDSFERTVRKIPPVSSFGSLFTIVASKGG